LATFAVSTAGAQAGTPRWYGKETGSLVPIGGDGGLVELMSPENLQSMGQLTVVVGKSVSVCLVKDRESIENPMNALLPGTGEMEEFEVVCEEGTGPGLNAAAPFPCVLVGEAFELKAVNVSWPSTLEVGGPKRSVRVRRKRATSIRNLPKYYDKFTGVDIEVYCLKSKQHAEYTGSLKPEVEVGRLTFRGPESGELEEASSGRRFYLKGSDWITPQKYKNIRVNSEYSEQPTITSLAPTNGPRAGGTSVTVEGRGFALGASATIFKFGSRKSTSVNCTSTTTCTVISPAGAVGTVDVKATVNKVSSVKNAPADQFTYN